MVLADCGSAQTCPPMPMVLQVGGMPAVSEIFWNELTVPEVVRKRMYTAP